MCLKACFALMSYGGRLAPGLQIFSGNPYSSTQAVKSSFKLEETKEFTELLEKYGVSDTENFYKEANKLFAAAQLKSARRTEKEVPDTIEVTTAEGAKFRIKNPAKTRGSAGAASLKVESTSDTMSPDEM